MTDPPEGVALRNREFYADAREVLARAAQTIWHFYSNSNSGMKFNNQRTDLDNPPARHLDGSELADNAFYLFSWGTRPHGEPFGLPDGGTQTVVERYWIRAVYRADGSLEVHSREGDVLIEDAEADPDASSGRITAVRSVALRGQQGFGKKGFRSAFGAALGHPVVVLETETVGPSDLELEEPTPYNDRSW